MYIEFLIAFAIGWFLGSKFTSTWLHITFREILRDLGVTADQMRTLANKNGLEIIEPEAKTSELPILEIRIEQHQGILFAFRKDNDQFLAQGPDREALIKRLTENLTNVRVVVDKEDGADLIKNG